MLIVSKAGMEVAAAVELATEALADGSGEQ
jgi:hypothetical protein